MASQTEQLHFVLFPFMAPGHVIPLLNMANLLSERNLTVTIILTHLYAARFGSMIDQSIVRLLKITFPSKEVGLPLHCESADTLPSHDLLPNFAAAVAMLQQPFEEMLIGLTPRPTCIICDKLITWTVDACDKLKMVRIVFDGMSCFTQVVIHNLLVSKICENVAPDEPFVVPHLLEKIKLTRAQLPGLFNPGPKHVPGFRERVRKTEAQAYGVVVNSFEEVEKRYVDEFRNLRGGKVWCIGPLSLYADLDRGNDDRNCLRWLSFRKPRSVVYACLGSLSSLSTAQFTELALGLEASDRPFLLVVRGGAKSEETEKWISNEGIEERVKNRGIFVRGWAPQAEILSHPSVGAFLTHCGWNSILEGICGGLPMITWPLFSEQFLNEKFVVQILGIGVGVGAKSVVHVGEEEKVESRVMRDGVKRAIERVMDEREEGCERRKIAKEMGEMGKRSIEEGGSSYLNVELLIQDIERLIVRESHDETDHNLGMMF
ncbi:hypothetical protein ACS0TY_023193 [Phlomoides rotata]